MVVPETESPPPVRLFSSEGAAARGDGGRGEPVGGTETVGLSCQSASQEGQSLVLFTRFSSADDKILILVSL